MNGFTPKVCTPPENVLTPMRRSNEIGTSVYRYNNKTLANLTIARIGISIRQLILCFFFPTSTAMTCSPSASFFLCFLITFAPLADGTSFDVLKNRTIESINVNARVNRQTRASPSTNNLLEYFSFSLGRYQEDNHGRYSRSENRRATTTRRDRKRTALARRGTMELPYELHQRHRGRGREFRIFFFFFFLL